MRLVVICNLLFLHAVLFKWIPLANAWLFQPTEVSKEICYGSLGCFVKGEPFTNTGSIWPRPPDYIGTKFFLFTRNSTHFWTNQTHFWGNSALHAQELFLSDKIRKCSWKSFCESRKIKIIIHGYMDFLERKWVQRMVKALLKRDNANVIVVDWRHGAEEIIYLQSVANTRVVGAQTAQLLRVLQRVYNLDLSTIHIIGHSLGAHIAGYVGEYLEGIGRITGLDPAGPAFENTDPQVRLDPTDADFVDVIHTDAEHFLSLGFGIKQAVGTVDFYVNGGKDQPGCPTTYFAQIGQILSGDFRIINNVACSHLRALHFFTESINSNCTFEAYPCPKIDTCNSCIHDECGIMGYNTEVTMTPGKYFIRTNSYAPYCIDQ